MPHQTPTANLLALPASDRNCDCGGTRFILLDGEYVNDDQGDTTAYVQACPDCSGTDCDVRISDFDAAQLAGAFLDVFCGWADQNPILLGLTYEEAVARKEAKLAAAEPPYEQHPTVDLTTPAGRAIARLYDDLQGVRQFSSCLPGSITVDVLTEWFASVGIDIGDDVPRRHRLTPTLPTVPEPAAPAVPTGAQAACPHQRVSVAAVSTVYLVVDFDATGEDPDEDDENPQMVTAVTQAQVVSPLQTPDQPDVHCLGCGLALPSDHPSAVAAAAFAADSDTDYPADLHWSS